MIKPESASIESLLTASIQYEVPDYQRDYKWRKAEALDLIEDLKSSVESDQKLFLGTVIFDVSKIGKKVVSIVDGQQRMTTILILLIACRIALSRIGETKVATLTQQRIAFVDSANGEAKGCRLIPSESVRQVIYHMSEDSWDGSFFDKDELKNIKQKVNKIKPIFDYFLSEFEALGKDAIVKMLRAIYDSYVIRIDINDMQEAFGIFERTNARGMELEASDLLKNHLFSHGVEKIAENWDKIVKNSNSSLMRMLKHFCVSNSGYVTKASLYNKLKQLSKDLKPEKLVNDLLDFSEFYSVIENLSEEKIREYLKLLSLQKIANDQLRYTRIFKSLEALKFFRVVQIYPLMYSAILAFKRTAQDADIKHVKALIEFFELLEKYHFINTTICERMGNEVEKLYADYSLRFHNTENFLNTYNDFKAELTGKLEIKSVFVASFKEISYEKESIGLICYIFDRINNYISLKSFGENPGARVKIFDPTEGLIRRAHNVEHFFPQKPKGVSKEEKDTLSVVNNIGNLLALGIQANSSLGNGSPSEKILKMENEIMGKIQNLPYVKAFIDEYKEASKSWDKAKIYERAEKLANFAFDKVWCV